MPPAKLDLNSGCLKKGAISAPGVFEVITIICYLVSSVIFLCTPTCIGTPFWYSRLYPVTAMTSCLFIGVFSVLLTVGILDKNCAIKWDTVNFICNVVEFVIMLTVSILTIVACNNNASLLHRFSAPIGILGAFSLLTSSTIWAVRSRSSKEVAFPSEERTEAAGSNQYRRSFVA